jgi:hypothetical protein
MLLSLSGDYGSAKLVKVDETETDFVIQSQGNGLQFRGDIPHAGAVCYFTGEQEAAIMTSAQNAIYPRWISQIGTKEGVDLEQIFDDLCDIPNLSLISCLRVITKEVGSEVKMPNNTLMFGPDGKDSA